MPSGITCPACGAELPANTAHADGRVPCPQCGAPVCVPILLPDPDLAPEPPVDPATLPRAVRSSHSRPPARRRPSVLGTLAIFGGLFAFAGCAGVVGFGWALWPVIVQDAKARAAGPVIVPPREPAAPAPAADLLAMAIEDLRSDDLARRRQGLDYFARTPVIGFRHREGAAALAAFPVDRHPELMDLYLDALAVWAGDPNAASMDALARGGGLTRERTLKVARVKMKLSDTIGAAKMLAPLAFRSPDQEADELLRKCSAGVDGVCQEWAFDADPAVRKRVFATLSAAWSDGEPGALRKLYNWSFYDGLDNPDPVKAAAAVSWLREFYKRMPPQGEGQVVELAGRLARLTARHPPAPGADPLAEYLAELVTRDNAVAVVRALGGEPRSHAAVARVFAAAARVPSKPLALDLIAWLPHPTLGPVAAAGLKALGRDVEPELRSAMASGSPEQRKQCRDLLVALIAPATEGGVREPTLRLLLADLQFDGARWEDRAAEAFAAIADLDPMMCSDADRDAVVAALVKQSTRTGPRRDRALVRALAVWATDRHADEVRMIVLGGATRDVSALLPMMGRLKTTEAVRAILATASNGANIPAAVAAITAVGPDAEPEVLARLDPKHGALNAVALCQMLEAIGTARALPALDRTIRHYYGDASVGVPGYAAKAIKAIKAREAKK